MFGRPAVFNHAPSFMGYEKAADASRLLLSTAVLSVSVHAPVFRSPTRSGGQYRFEELSQRTAYTGLAGKDTPTNPRGIPYAPFIKVEDYVTTRADVESALKKFQEMISKYQFMEVNTQRRAAGLKDKIPDMQKTLDTVRFLATRSDDAEPLETTFELNDTLYAKASVAKTEEVYLWLGANVMLAYPMLEAETLLSDKLTAAQTSLAKCEEDLDFLREQITTMEVATARVYNWDVGQRRKERGEDGGRGGDGESGRPNG
nr:putative prefoldin subunit 3 [Quercus suber]